MIASQGGTLYEIFRLIKVVLCEERHEVISKDRFKFSFINFFLTIPKFRVQFNFYKKPLDKSFLHAAYHKPSGSTNILEGRFLRILKVKSDNPEHWSNKKFQTVGYNNHFYLESLPLNQLGRNYEMIRTS